MYFINYQFPLKHVGGGYYEFILIWILHLFTNAVSLSYFALFNNQQLSSTQNIFCSINFLLLNTKSWVIIFFNLATQLNHRDFMSETRTSILKSPCRNCLNCQNMTRSINHRLHTSTPCINPPEAYWCKHKIVPGLHREVCVSLWLWHVSQCPESLKGTRCRLWLNQTDSPLCLTSHWVKTDFYRAATFLTNRKFYLFAVVITVCDVGEQGFYLEMVSTCLTSFVESQ